MKAVMISINPKWCGLIASGKKTLEIRKTQPKLKSPFKCYIYCTNEKKLQFWTNKRYSYADDHSHNLFDRCGNGKVIGEFVCDTMIVDKTYGHGSMFREMACMSQVEAASYCLNAKMYGWHISDLKIYDEPKQLSSFCVEDKAAVLSCEHRKVVGQPEYKTAHGGWIKGSYICNKGAELDWCERCRHKPLKRPPQSWCYVEEV